MEKPATLEIDVSQFRDVIFIQDMDLNITFVSPSVRDMFGYTVAEAYCLKIEDLLVKDSLQKAFQAFEIAFNLANTKPDVDIPLLELEYRRKDGTTFWGELKVSFLRDREGNLIGSQGILRNVDERKKAEKKLRLVRLKFKTLFDISPLAITLTEISSGKLLEVNEKLCEITRLSRKKLIGKPLTQLGFYTKEERKKFLAELSKTGEVHGYEIDFKTRNGTVLNTQIFAKIIDINGEQAVLAMFYDITREKRLENQFIQAQKLEALGSLAGGLAHDFNNLLMGIQGKVSLMLLKSDDNHPHHGMLTDIQKNVKSCTDLTRQLLGYARKEKPEVTPICLNDLIEETASSFQRARKQINLKTILATDLQAVDADPVQVEQVLYNLYVNAADAMPNGGQLTITTTNIHKKELVGRLYKPKKDNYVSMVVSDTGCGMDKKTLNRIFEPFFTTKEKGKGTGLGLASAYGIIKGHGGYIDVKSTPQKGTTFYIYLPASEKSIDQAKAPKSEMVKTGGTVLLVDDETIVLDVAAQMLEQIGFTVISASSGAEAIEIYKNKNDLIDIVILDVIMPGMNGGECFDGLKKISKDVKVLLSSGYGIENHISDILRRGCVGFLQKPFTLEMLSEKIGPLLKKPASDKDQ